MHDPSRLIALMSAALLSSPAPAQSTGLDDLVGARAGQAEAEILRRGYANVRGEKGDDRSYAYWWSAARRQCVTVATINGRFDSITPTTAPDCRQPANLRPRPGGGQATRPGYETGAGAAAIGRPDIDRPEMDRPVIDGRDVRLGLVCFGDGARDGLASRTTWTWNARRDRYEQGRYTETRREVFDASLMIQTWDGGGRIRLPKSLIPPINSRGADGWWALYDVTVGADVIQARYRLNGLNKPSVTIDRRRGTITVKGLSDYGFRGTCDAIGHDTRRF